MSSIKLQLQCISKAETSSVASFKPGESSGVADNASQRSEDTGPASLSSLEELTSGLLRRVTGGRRRLEKQVTILNICKKLLV